MKKTLFALAAVGLMAFAACTNLDTVVDEGAQKEIGFTSYTSMATKSAIDGAVGLPSSYAMAVSASWNPLTSGGSRTDYFQGYLFRENSGVWKGHNGTTWKPKYWPVAGNLDFIAYATAGMLTDANGAATSAVWGADGNVAKQVVVTVDPESAGDDIAATFEDLVYGKANAQTYVAAGNPMTMNHAGVAVCFAFQSNVPFVDDNTAEPAITNVTDNYGITITGISVNGVKTKGAFTFINGSVAGGSDADAASWVTSGSDANVAARLYGGSPAVGNETVLSNFPIAVTTAPSFSDKHFGDAYVLLPVQGASTTYGKGTSFTITYTMHNGTGNDVAGLTYTHDCTADNWAMGTKVLYTINITMNEITIVPSVADWSPVSMSTISPTTVPTI